MKILPIVCAVTLTALSHGAFAANTPPPSTSEALDCVQVIAHANSTFETMACQDRKQQSAEVQLNMVYNGIRTFLAKDPEQDTVSGLRDSQRAWLVWRDKEAELCALAQGWGPTGSGYSGVADTCKQRLTSSRVAQLRELFRDIVKRY